MLDEKEQNDLLEKMIDGIEGKGIWGNKAIEISRKLGIAKIFNLGNYMLSLLSTSGVFVVDTMTNEEKMKVLSSLSASIVALLANLELDNVILMSPIKFVQKLNETIQ